MTRTLTSRLPVQRPTGCAQRPQASGRELDQIAALTKVLDLQTFRSIMAYPTWNFVCQAIVASRSYERGWDGGLLLFRYAEEHQDNFGRAEFESYCVQLWFFILEMLDRLDEWDAYLTAWESVRAHTDYALTYVSGARRTHGARLAPFIIGEDSNGLAVHFLWLTLHRKEVIERKVARRRRGQKLGNLMHARQEELSDGEIRDRLMWVVRLAREVSGER